MSVDYVAEKAAEATAGSLLVVASAGWIPLVVALPAALYYLLMSWETDTARALRGRVKTWVQDRLS